MATVKKPTKPTKLQDNVGVTIDHETQQVDVKHTLPNYVELGQSLYIIVTEHRDKFRNKVLDIFEQVGHDIDGYKAVAEAYAKCYVNKDTAKNMKSVLMAVFKAYIADSKTMLDTVKDETKFYPDWAKVAREINGKGASGRKPKENLTDTERDVMTEKIDNFATPKDAEVIIDHAFGKLNGEMRFALIHKLMDATLNDPQSEAIFKGWAGQHIAEVEELLNRVYTARKQAQETTETVKKSIQVEQVAA